MFPEKLIFAGKVLFNFCTWYEGFLKKILLNNFSFGLLKYFHEHCQIAENIKNYPFTKTSMFA